MLAGVTHISAGDVEVVIGLLIAGFVGWRWKRGDFYKAVAIEKTAQADKLQEENERLHALTDITPILGAIGDMATALQRHAEMTEAVFQKVADMNGSLRHHSEAMKALADRLILDEAARGLLEAAKSTERRTP